MINEINRWFFVPVIVVLTIVSAFAFTWSYEIDCHWAPTVPLESLDDIVEEGFFNPMHSEETCQRDLTDDQLASFEALTGTEPEADSFDAWEIRSEIWSGVLLAAAIAVWGGAVLFLYNKRHNYNDGMLLAVGTVLLAGVFALGVALGDDLKDVSVNSAIWRGLVGTLILVIIGAFTKAPDYID